MLLWKRGPLLPVSTAVVLLVVFVSMGFYEVGTASQVTPGTENPTNSVSSQPSPQLQQAPEESGALAERVSLTSVEAPVEEVKENSPQPDVPLDNTVADLCTVTRGPFSESRTQKPLPEPSVAPAKTPKPHQTFAQWLDWFRAEALERGISPATLNAAFKGLTPNPKILKLDRRQQEYSLTFFQYLRSGISESRIKRGRALLKEHAALLDKVHRKYGVPPQLLVALWGMETDFGANTGGFGVIRSLASLAYDGRRSEMYRGELLCALRIIEDGHIAPAKMIGSWAGAMGQPQFMPSTFMRFAKDGNGDGKYDIWNTLPDVFESAANYLAASGWERGRTWGREVRLPSSFDPYEARLATVRTLSEWRDLGLVKASGGPLPQADIKGSVILPAGIKGPAFLVYKNFRVITEWNRSLLYALTVGHLSDRIAGDSPLIGKAPPGDRRLSRKEVVGLQEDLNRLGFKAGPPDGMVGMKTRAAVRSYQRARGIPADGYPTPKLIAKLNAETGGPEARESHIGKAELLTLQESLDRLGYDVGTPDGILGPRTRRGVRTYQRKNSIPVDGVPTRELLRRVVDEARAPARR